MDNTGKETGKNMSIILAIDDKKDNLITLSALLHHLLPDCRVYTAQSGAEGIETARSCRPDVILLDVKMPDMDGYETCRRLKNDEIVGAVPIIMVTAIKTDSASRIKGLDLGAEAFLAKPIDEAELVSQVKVALRIKRAEDALRRERDCLEETIAERTRELQTANTRLEALWSVTSLIDAGVKTISDHILKTLATMTGSAYGFYGFVNEDESGMTIHSWSGEAMKNCAMVDKPSYFATCSAGIWAEAIRRREPFILNNYGAGHPAKKGLPEGHVELTNLLVVPFMTKGRITSIAAVANRHSDYDQDDVLQLNSFLTSIQSIVDSKRAEEILAQKAALLTKTEEISRTGSWRYVLDSGKVAWSDQMYTLFGLKKDTFDHHIESVIARAIHPDDRAKVAQLTAAMGRDGSTQPMDYRVVHPDGSVRWVHAQGEPELDAAGRIVAIVGFVQDITAQMEMENKLRQAQKMEAIGTLAGGIAHDFNNILGAIIGYAEMIRDDALSASAPVQDIDQVLKAGHRAKELVKQILAFSRQGDSRHIPVQPATIIREAVKLLRASIPTTIAIEQDIASDVGIISADPTQLHQIVINLCTNAFHAMEMDGGTLKVSLKRKVLNPEDLADQAHMQPGDYLQLLISDTGVGIAPEIRERIFDPYFTTKEVGKGTGMGLATVHGIVRSYGGAVTCRSQPGEGTTFQVLLPCCQEVEAVVENKPVLPVSPCGKEEILFVDDEEILLEMGTIMLERLGYRVTARSSSLEALTTFQNQPQRFDLVISDQTMPGMTGVDLSRRILQIRPDLPIILCTGYSNLITEEKAQRMGIKGFAMKPLAKNDVAVLIRKVLDGKNKAIAKNS